MPDENFATVIPEGLGMAGKTEEVLAAVRRAKTSDLETIMMNSMALVQIGRAKEAVAEANKIKDVDERDDILALISKKLAKAGRTEEATAVANQIKGEGGYSLNEALGKIAEALAKAGKSAEALTTVRKIKEKMTREIWLAIVIEELAKAGKVNEALEAVQEIGDEASRSQTLIAVVDAFTDAGRIDEATAIAHKIKDNYGLALSHSYKQARQAADLCHSPLARLKAYFVILTSYAIEKNPDLKTRLEAEDINM